MTNLTLKSSESWRKWEPTDKRRLLRKIRYLNLWNPLPGPQAIAFRECEADIIGYGGAAGGGKSDLALGFAILQHHRSLILRREFKNVRALVDRAREILGDFGQFNGSAGIWGGLPGNRQIEFGGVKNPGDEQSYRGRPHDLIVFDEADQFPEMMVRFLSGWLRTTVPGQRCRVLLNFNPPSSTEGEWLLRFFAPWVDEGHSHPAKPGELRWYAVLSDGKEIERPDGEPFLCPNGTIDPRTGEVEIITPKSRTFIPAKLIDNPFLMATNYGSTLQSLPEPLRSQLLYGDFTVGRLDDAWQVIPTAWVKAAQARWTEEPPTGQALSCIGVDVAYGGADRTVVSPRYGNWFGRLKKYQGRDTDSGEKAAHLVLREYPDNSDAPVNVDAIGYGAPCAEALQAKLGKKRAIAVNVAASPEPEMFDRTRKYKLPNIRSAMHWKLREALDPVNGENLALPPDPELLADLTAARFEVRSSGIIIEKKADIKERLGHSPDCAEAVMLAHWQGKLRKLCVFV